MQTWIPFIPENASTVAGSVDALYFFLVSVSVFFALLIAGLELYFAVRYRPVHPAKSPLPFTAR